VASALSATFSSKHERRISVIEAAASGAGSGIYAWRGAQSSALAKRQRIGYAAASRRQRKQQRRKRKINGISVSMAAKSSENNQKKKRQRHRGINGGGGSRIEASIESSNRGIGVA